MSTTRPEDGGGSRAGAPSRRQRLREATLRDIADAGRRQLAAVGPQGMTLSALAREVGMTAPGLYRYVDGVDGVLTLLIAEGFADLARCCEDARDAVVRSDPSGRFAAVAGAMRDWALRDVPRYGLLFGSPLPGYSAPEGGPTTAAARRAVGVLWQVVVDAEHDGLLADPLVDDVDPAALPSLVQTDGEAVPVLSPPTQAAAWACVSLLLGSVTSEVFGLLPPSDGEIGEALYRGKVEVALRIVGLPSRRRASTWSGRGRTVD